MSHSTTLRPRITVTGFGDVGQSYVRALMAQGLEPRVHHPFPKARALSAAAAMGVRIETEPRLAYAECDLVLNVAPGSQALTVALQAAAVLAPTALFADLSSAAPSALREAAAHFASSVYVDCAIMGAVSIHGHQTPLLASGDGAQRLVAWLEPLGFRVQVLRASAPGDATALKLIRSVLTKGLDAVVIECMLVAEALGLRDELLGQMADLDESTLSELIAMYVRTHAPHALRRLQEVQAVEQTLQGLGLPLIMTVAARQRYERSVHVYGDASELPAGVAGESPYDRVLPWMLKAERDAPLAGAVTGRDAPLM